MVAKIHLTHHPIENLSNTIKKVCLSVEIVINFMAVAQPRGKFEQLPQSALQGLYVSFKSDVKFV